MNTQVNVRLDDQLLEEIDVISDVLHVSRTEWLRMKIALAAKEDSLNLREAIALEYARGHISKERLKAMLGSDADDVVLIADTMRKGRSYIDGLRKRK